MNNENPQDTNIIMTADPVTITPDLTASDALKKMYHAHYRSMPVVDAEDHFVGLFSIYRLIELLLPRAALARQGSLDNLSFVHENVDELVERAGTILACYFIKYQKHSAKEAIEKIRKERPGSIQSDVQEMAITFYEKHIS